MPGIFEGYPIVNQKFNPENDVMWMGGENAPSVGTIIRVQPIFDGGVSGLVVTTSACTYSQAITEFNTEPIAISHIKMVYKNGGASLDNLLRYLFESSFGACEKIVKQPRSQISATDDTDLVVDFDFCGRELILDSAHSFALNIPAGEKVIFLFFYRQAERQDILRNKMLR